MLSIMAPVVRRKVVEPRVSEPINPFIAAAQALGFKPPLDVEARLSSMSFGGSGESAIHTTQLAVSASLLSKGHEVGEVVGLLLDATRAAAGDYGVRWNWRREEKSLRLMCEAWLRKHPAAPREAPTPQVRDAEGPAVAPSGDNVVSLPTGTAPRTTTNVMGTGGEVVNMDEVKRAVRRRRPRGKARRTTSCSP
jgi:hypothetical protein